MLHQGDCPCYKTDLRIPEVPLGNLSMSNEVGVVKNVLTILTVKGWFEGHGMHIEMSQSFKAGVQSK